MKKLQKKDVNHLAKLANLSLTQTETQKFSSELSNVLEHVTNLKNINAKGLRETHQVAGKTNQFRQDQVKPGLTQKQALQNSPNTYRGYFVVERLINHE